MNQSGCRDLGVFDFKEEDEVAETYHHHWSKFSNPKSDDDAITKYQFLQFASTCSVTQLKGVRTVENVNVVAIDDDDHGAISDISRGVLDMMDNTGSRRSEGFGSISDRGFAQHCHFTEDIVDRKSSLPDMERRVSSLSGPSLGNDHISFTIPDSPSRNGSAGVGTSDSPSPDSSQESSPSTPASVVQESDVPMDGRALDQLVSGREMDEMDCIDLHADYITYRDKYFPVSHIMFSKNAVEIRASDLEEECGAFRFEWEINDILGIESHWSSVADLAKVKLRLLTKGAVLAENAQGTAGVEVLEFLIHDRDWPRKKEFIMSLDTRYKAAWSIGLNGKSFDGDAFSVESECSSDPYIPNFDEPFEEVVYPEGDVDAVSISKRDVDLLQPETFVNDTIIDFYIKYLKNEIPLQERQRFHFFNSFFFRKLADLDKNPSSAFDSKAAFQRVRKWTRKVNIFEKDYLFIPVNYNLHWSLIIICHPGEVANFNDESMDDIAKVPCILHMDSIRGSHTGLKDLVQSYLLEEWKERNKDSSEDIPPKFLNLRFLSLELPQQENCSDCGLFLLHYAELFIAEAPANFSPFLINKYENFLKPDWFMPAEASLKRVHIQRLIYELLGKRSPVNASPSCNLQSHHSGLLESNENDNGIELISDKRSPGKSWNRNSSNQGTEMGLLDVSLYSSTSQCIDLGLGMREVLAQGQNYDQGASFGQLGCPLSPIREEAEADERRHDHSNMGQSQTGFELMDEVTTVNCHPGYSPRNFSEGFQWNSDLSEQEEPEEGDLSPMSNYSPDDSEEELRIIEPEGDPDLNRQHTSSGQNQNLDQSKENLDSLTESYASASSDVMETPAEDSQELNKIFGSDDHEDPLPSDQEVVLRSQQEPSKNEDDGDDDDDDDDDDDGVSAGVEEKLVAQDSSSEQDEDEEKDGERVEEKLVAEDSSSEQDEERERVEEKLVAEDSSSDVDDEDEERAPKRIRLAPSIEGEKTGDVVISLNKEEGE